MVSRQRHGRQPARRNPQPRNRFVFQTFNLLARSNALHNVELPLIYAACPRRTPPGCARRAHAGRTGRPHSSQAQRTFRRPAPASGRRPRPGQQAFDPAADEPTGNLDSKPARKSWRCSRNCPAKANTIILVTHRGGHRPAGAPHYRLRDGLVASDEAMTK